MNFKQLKNRNSADTYISTRSTLTPQGSVASSNELCIVCEMVSRSDKISAKFFVPKTLRSVVAASKRVEWLRVYNRQVRKKNKKHLSFLCSERKTKNKSQHSYFKGSDFISSAQCEFTRVRNWIRRCRCKIGLETPSEQVIISIFTCITYCRYVRKVNDVSLWLCVSVCVCVWRVSECNTYRVNESTDTMVSFKTKTKKKLNHV